MVLMDVGGADAFEMAAALKVSVAYVRTVRKSPLYQVQLAEVRERLETKVTNDLAEVLTKMNGEAGKSLDKIISIRDNAKGDTPDAVQLAAANSILDRTVPKKTEAPVDRRQYIILSDEAAARMAGVLREAGISPPPAAAGPTPLESAIHAAEEAELVDEAGGPADAV